MSGENFYLRQANGGTTDGKRPSAREPLKKPRILKKDIIAELNKSLGADIVGLEKTTVATLTQLMEAITNVTNV